MACRCQRDTEMKYPRNRDDAQMLQQRYSSPSTWQDFMQPNNMKNDDDKKSAPLHLCTSVSLANSLACLFCCFFVFSGNHRLHCL
jgi:hypothetical protein